ncbi:MAG: hypothetical protein H0T47_15105 [Planctomycetaceae bacterium]|nr:hypothetical protein [Planctomycetaceae bacterium]
MAKKKVARKLGRKGRPVRGEGEFDHLNMRIAAGRKARWQQAAAHVGDRGVTLAEFVRMAGDALADRLLGNDDEIGTKGAEGSK